MRWGVRRYQNKDGSRTSAGKARYGGKTSRYERREALADRLYESPEGTQEHADSYFLRWNARTGGVTFAAASLITTAPIAMLIANKAARGTGAKKAAAVLGAGLGTVAVSSLYGAIGSERIAGKTEKKYTNPSNKAEKTVGEKFRQYKQFNQQLNESAKEYKQATKNMSRSEKKQLPKNRNEYMKIYMEANNNVAAKLNSKVEAFNAKWAKEFEGYDDWSKSPKYGAYEKAFADQYNEAMEKEMERLYKSKYGK